MGWFCFSRVKILGYFTPSAVISTNYGGTYTILTPDNYGGMTPSGYYNPSSGQVYINSSS
jgi:hypothetical protein